MKACANKHWMLAILIFACTLNSISQTVSGRIIDALNKEPLIGANVYEKDNTLNGTTTDIDGKFSLMVPKKETTVVVISYLGYAIQEIIASAISPNMTISLELDALMTGDEIVITASRREEKLREAPIDIQKLSAKQIQNTAGGDFYQGLGYLKGVDINASSMGFQVVNMRGFNTTAPVRIVQFIDGMDNQAPGLNFPVGNLVGLNDLDIQSVEVITGAASALYGANAFQGVVNMQSKNPYDYPGLQVKVKGGTREMADAQFRYANSFGKDKKLGFKITGGYFRALDWAANDPEANNYGDISAEVDLSRIVRSLQFDEDPERAADFVKLNAYLDFYPVAYPGTIEVTAPGYMESSMLNKKNITQSSKLGTYLSYKFKEDTQLELVYKFGMGTAIYQGANRYSINNIRFHQAKADFKWKGLNLKAYSTIENAGDSYDLVFTAINLSKTGIENYVKDYIANYIDALSDQTNEFGNSPSQQNVLNAHQIAKQLTDQNGNFLQPGTTQFDSAYQAIVTNPDLNEGSRFLDRSALYHVEGVYDFKNIKKVELLVGGAYRHYAPNSEGTIFTDKDNRISVWEMGYFTQLGKSLFSDKLKLTGSLRVDKHENFKAQFSPRFSMVSSFNDNVIRFSAQTAFRSPTLQNQYIGLDLGAIYLTGNLNGVNNAFDIESVKDFNNQITVRPELLRPVTYKKLQPEQVISVEAGYRGIWVDNFYLDIGAYINWYNNFIADVRYYEPLNGQAGEESGLDDVLLKNYRLVQTPINVDQRVMSFGFDLGANYYIYKSLMLGLNYSRAKLVTADLDESIIPGFNTPLNKINVSLSATRIAKGFGFGLNMKWVDEYFWQSPFGDGTVPSYVTMDAQVNYEFDKFITLQFGGSNIFNQRYIQAFGAPLIGGIMYGTVIFDLNRK
jgi:iron complex outermembrane recepter protein